MSVSTTYTISELAKQFEITSRTIRFYEDQGLLSPSRVNSQRVYDEGDFIRLKLILRGKRIGFSLAEIKETMSLYDTQPDEKVQLQYVMDTIGNHRQDLIKRKADIERTLLDMENVQKRIEDQLELLGK